MLTSTLLPFILKTNKKTGVQNVKTTKEERIFKMVKDFIRIHKGNMVDAQKIFDTVISSNPYLSNSKLTTDERTFISEQVKKASV